MVSIIFTYRTVDTYQQIPAVGRPSNTRQGTEVRGIAVYKSDLVRNLCEVTGKPADLLLGDGINYSQATVF